MNNIINKVKEIEIGEISLLTEQKRKYSSPKSKNNINPKISKYFQSKKISKTSKKQKKNIIINNENEKLKKNVKQKQILLFPPKDNNKKEYPIVINTSQNFTPNKPREIDFKLSQTQNKGNQKWVPTGTINFSKENMTQKENNKNNYINKGNRLVYKSINKENKSKTNINSLIMNFKKDIPNYQYRIQSLNSKKNDIIENNSYLITKKRGILKGNNIEVFQKRNEIKKNLNNKYNKENYTIKIIKKKNPSIKNKKDENNIFDNDIDKEYFKSYIFNKYSISFVKDPSKIKEFFENTNNIKILNEKNKKKTNKIQYKINNNKNNNIIKRSFVNKNLINSKVKSSINIKEKNKSMVLVKKMSHSSLKTNKKYGKSKKSLKFLDKNNNTHQMTELSETFNNHCTPNTINKIKLSYNSNYKHSADNKDLLQEKEDKYKGEEQIIKKIKKNLDLNKISTNNKKNKSNRNNRNNKDKTKNIQYEKINSNKILITNININLYKDGSYTNKNENLEKNFSMNSDDIRNKNLKEPKYDLEKIYLLEEKSHKILLKINEYKICDEECLNWITFFFSTNFYKKRIELFVNNNNQKKISNYIKLELLCYFLCYDISFNENFSQASILIKTIINLLYENNLILVSYIIYLNNSNTYENNAANNLWLNKIKKTIDIGLKINLTSQDMNENSILSLIINTTERINNYYKMIIDNLYSYPNDNDKLLLNKEFNFPDCLNLDLNTLNDIEKSQIKSIFFLQAYKLLNNYSYENMKLFFYLFLNNQKFNSQNSSSIIKDNINNINFNQYYLPPIKPNYKYSLIINMDETLIYNDNGKLLLRPYLYDFLDLMKELYELIVFSFYSNSFIDNALEIIEQRNKYFDYILYSNQFTINNNGQLVKDLESLGRELKNIIVVDSKSHLETRFQNNLILIKGYYGNDLMDTNLLKILGYILQNIKKENYEDDIRKSIEKHKNTIKAYLTSNIS